MIMAVRSFHVVFELDVEDNVWVTSVPTLDFLSTYGETREEAIANPARPFSGMWKLLKKRVCRYLPVILKLSWSA